MVSDIPGQGRADPVSDMSDFPRSFSLVSDLGRDGGQPFGQFRGPDGRLPCPMPLSPLDSPQEKRLRSVIPGRYVRIPVQVGAPPVLTGVTFPLVTAPLTGEGWGVGFRV